MSTLSRFETLEPREAALTEAMVHMMRRGMPAADLGPQPTALLQARLVVSKDVPPPLRVGLWATPGSYDAWVRLGSASLHPQPDSVPDRRALAMKVLNVAGAKIAESDEPDTQDFVLTSSPIVPWGTVQVWHDVMAARAQQNSWRLVWKLLRTGNVQVLRAVKKHKITPASPLDIRYYSGTPYLLGDDRVVKYGVRPTSATVSAMPPKAGPHYLTEATQRHLAQAEATFDFLLQVRRGAGQPVENAAVEWSEHEAPFVKVASLIVPPQVFTTSERHALAAQLTFSPAHALAAHRPVGGLNRARMHIDRAMAAARAPGQAAVA